MKTFDKETNQWVVKITKSNIDDYRNKVVHNPLQHISNDYTSVDVGGMNLNVGEMVEKAKTTKLYGGSPTSMTIKDNSEATLYLIDLKSV